MAFQESQRASRGLRESMSLREPQKAPFILRKPKKAFGFGFGLIARNNLVGYALFTCLSRNLVSDALLTCPSRNLITYTLFTSPSCNLVGDALFYAPCRVNSKLSHLRQIKRR